jgi:FkbM family methyltransferase
MVERGSAQQPQAGSESTLSIAEIERRLTALERAIGARIPNIAPEWTEPRWYESAVQLALSKLLHLGDFAFDLGANIGVISAMMGATVGPFGRVVAFEASSRNIGQLHVNLNNSNAFNVTVVHAAVAERSGETLPMYYGSNSAADTVNLSTQRVPDAYATSLALDDYVERLGVPPRVVKIDIEGAELRALRGFQGNLAKHHPALVIETLSTDLLLDAMLQSLGYDLCVDVNSLTPFDKRAATGPYLCNLVYLHSNEDRGKVFRSARRTEVSRFAAGDLKRREEELYLDLGILPAGLYVVHFDFSSAAAEIKETLDLRLRSPDRTHSVYIAPFAQLARSQRSIPFELKRQMSTFVSFSLAAAEKVADALPAIRLERLGA